MSGFIPNTFLVSSENTHSLSNNSDMSGFIPNNFLVSSENTQSSI